MTDKTKSFLTYISIFAVGAVLSIVLHEAFHYAMHYGHIVRIDFFTNNNIVQVVAMTPRGYNVLGEELVAYSITILTVVLFAVLAVKVSNGAHKARKEKAV